MSFIGNVPAESYSPVVKDTFSGNDSTTDFTLSIPATTNSVEVLVENVQQEPTTAYTISGTTLSFTAAPVTGTNNIYVIHRGPAVQTVVPPAGVALNPSTVTATGDISTEGDLKVEVTSGGIYTITGTDTATNRTLTLPDEAGTVLTTGSTAFATGMMKQVGHALNQTYSNMNLTGGGFNDVTGLSVTVTPNSASSKFFLYARVHGELSQNEHQVSLRFLRDSTPVNVGTATQSGQNEVMYTSGDALNGNAASTPITGTMFTLDSPNTTASITYKVQLSDQGNNLNFYLNGTVNDTTGIGIERGSSELIVLEVF